jgi:hypothetical protein
LNHPVAPFKNMLGQIDWRRNIIKEENDWRRNIIKEDSESLRFTLS